MAHAINPVRLLVGLSLLLFASFPNAAFAKWDEYKGCLSCHEGIERISDSRQMKNLSCVDCHKGDGDATTLEAGHRENRQKTAYSWSESRSYLRWESPILGINSKGKVSPFITGCQLFLTQVDGDKQRLSNHVYTTVDGTSGLAQNPIQPHTINAGSRSCADCHMNPKTLGLGSGFYDIKDNFPDGPAPVDFELERIVDEDGKQLQATNHIGSRPFNKEELDRISRVGTCMACHAEDGVDLAGKGPDDKAHQKAIRKLRK